MEIIMIWSKITMLTIHEFHGSTAPVAWLNHGKNPHFDGSNLSKIDGQDQLMTEESGTMGLKPGGDAGFVYT